MKSSNSRAIAGIKLDTLSAMRVACWFNNLKAQSGLSADEMQEAPHLVDLSTINFQLYAEQRRKPSIVTLNLIEKEFPGTLEIYDVGPAGLPLWKVLAGDRDTCVAVVDAQLALMSDAARQKLFFKEKVGRFWRFLLPEYLRGWKSVEELIATPGYNIFSGTYEKGLKDDARYKLVKNEKNEDVHVLYSPSGASDTELFTRYYADVGRTYSCPVIMAVIALWKLCPYYPESDADAMCHYMVKGLTEQAIQNEFPEEIGLLLKGYLLKELATCEQLKLRSP